MLHEAGDLVTIMIIAYVGIYVVRWLSRSVPSLQFMILPMAAGILAAVGHHVLPISKLLMSSMGEAVAYSASLQPLLMGAMLAVIYGVVIVSPFSTVALSLAIGISGNATGCASLGVAMTAIFLVYGSYVTQNASGVTLALALGGMKLMIPNMVRTPMLFLPIVITNIILGALGAAIGISGTAASAGFGLVGLIGPLAAWSSLGCLATPVRVGVLVMLYFAIPCLLVGLSDLVFRKFLRLYTLQSFEQKLI